MAITEATIMSWIIRFVIFAFSALPLYFAVSLFRKRVSFLKVLLVVFITGFLVEAIRSYFQFWGFLIAFIILIWIYREVFRLKWINALLVWLLQLIFIIIFNILFWLVAGLMGLGMIALF